MSDHLEWKENIRRYLVYSEVKRITVLFLTTKRGGRNVGQLLILENHKRSTNTRFEDTTQKPAHRG